MAAARHSLATLPVGLFVTGCGSSLPTPWLDPDIPPGGRTASDAMKKARAIGQPCIGPEEVVSRTRGSGPWGERDSPLMRPYFSLSEASAGRDSDRARSSQPARTTGRFRADSVARPAQPSPREKSAACERGEPRTRMAATGAPIIRT